MNFAMGRFERQFTSILSLLRERPVIVAVEYLSLTIRGTIEVVSGISQECTQ
jgi:hypothetical protein